MTSTTKITATQNFSDGLKPSRRQFLKWSSVVAGATGLAAATPQLGLIPAKANETDSGITEVWSCCMVDCGSRCPLRCQVKDGEIVRILPDNTGGNTLDEPWQIRACVRGRSIRHRVYHPDRLKKPLKRVEGTKRGEGQYEEISWEQALDEIAEKYKRILDEYGPESVFSISSTGVMGAFISQSYAPNGGPVPRLLNLLGGFLDIYGSYSVGGITEAMRLCLGGYMNSHSSDDILNTKLYVNWAHSPLDNRMGGGCEVFYLPRYIEQAGIRTYSVDPRQSATVANLADEWIALRPGTDSALVAGLAHVLITENLHDQEFLDKYCVGFDEKTLPESAPAGSSYRSYIMGEGPDKTEKTAEWAAHITGVPAKKIIQFAKELGNSKPSMIVQGWSAQRGAGGENHSRAVITLNAMLGNPGVPGGGLGTALGSAGLNMVNPFTPGENPVTKKISHYGWLEAIERGAEMRGQDGVRDWDANGDPIMDPELGTNLKCIWGYATNTLINQNSDINRAKKILADDSMAELIVLIENQWTSSCEYADYVLPGTTSVEEDDLAVEDKSANMGYTVLSSQVIEPLYECKSAYDICAELAERLGVGDKFTEGKTQLDWVKQMVEETRKEEPNMPPYEEFKKQGVFKEMKETARALVEFRKDPEANPLETPSGKIEIYSEECAWKRDNWDLPEGDVITAVPEHIRTWESAEEAMENSKYPLQLSTYHFKGRVHSTYGTVDWLEEAHHNVAWLNPLDAKDRGIESGDMIDIFNDRGRVRVEVQVTGKIRPDVVSIPEGAWYRPDDNMVIDGHPVDIGACPNTLTNSRPTALAKSNAQTTALVQVEKA